MRQAMGAPYSLTLVVGGLGFVLATQTSGVMAIVLLTIAAGCSIIYPMGAAMVAYIVGMKQRPIVMSVLGATGSLGAIVSPVLVGWLMENAGYRPAPAGTVQTAEMVSRMVTGVNQSFLIAGLLLLVSGLLGLAFIRPDRTAKKLQGSVTL